MTRSSFHDKTSAAAILREVQSAGEVTVEELVDRLGVSAPTIRRDLTALEQQRILRLTHGGATAVQTIHYEAFAYDSSDREQEVLRADEKKARARRSLSHLSRIRGAHADHRP